MTKTKVSNDHHYEDATRTVLEALEAGTVVWQKTWRSELAGGPSNIESAKPYRGINVFLLDLETQVKGYSSNRWATYKQIAERGGQVRKGEKSTRIVFWRIIRKEETIDGQARTRSIPLLRTYNVFNEDQADWDPEHDRRRPVPERVTVDPIEACETLVAGYLASGPSLAHGGDQACYRPGSDHVQMPDRDSFESAEAYYSTLFHELTHSTGHSRRLGRQGIAEGTFGSFGDPVYSFEELVAEMGAAMLCAVAGIDQAATIPNTAAYLAHWRDALRGDNRLIVQAAAQAQKAVDLICGVSFKDDDDQAA